MWWQLGLFFSLMVYSNLPSSVRVQLPIYLYINAESSTPESQELTHIIDHLSTNLSAHQIEVRIVSDRAEANITIGLDEISFTPELTFISVYVGVANTAFELNQSSILQETFGVSTELSLQHYPEVANFITGYSLYAVGYCQEAITYFDSIPIPGSAVTQVWFYKGVCSLLHEDSEQAIDLFEQALFLDLDYPTRPCLLCDSVAVNLSWLYLQAGEEEKAFELMDQMVEITLDGLPDTPENMIYQSKVLSYRAQLYALVYRYDDAIADLNTAIELDPYDPELYVLRGQIYLYLYEWDSSLAEYNRVIERYHNYADAYFYRGVLYYSILQTGVELRAEALADFRHYLELAPDGDHAADAARYIEQIETELEALNS
jgi:tetratricopeptide (TPR) repeat protein